MENEKGKYYQSYSGYEFSARKGRGKKKIQSKAKMAFNSSGDPKSESGTEKSLDNYVVTDNISREHKHDDILDDIEDEEDIKGDKVEVVEDTHLKTPESSVVKQNMEDEPVFYENNDPKNQYSPINTRALPEEATTYELETFEKNAMIIINQDRIDGHLPRYGTNIDVESLKDIFTDVGFEVTQHNDLTKDELLKELETFSERNFTNFGCVVVAILTHGTDNGFLLARDQRYSEIEVFNQFKDKPFLKTKPKLFIIQACRGTRRKQGVPVFHPGRVHKEIDEVEPYILPVESDLLILHSSSIGSVSFRNMMNGSWFIQALCSKIKSLSSTHDFESIITEVQRDVAINRQYEEYNRSTLEMDIIKQMPVTTSTLTRKLYLRKFEKRAKETRVVMLRQPSESRNEGLDTVSNSTPITPLPVQLESCTCFLKHFTYMRDCLRYFVEEYPYDEIAQTLLEVANTFEDGVKFNTPKEKMCKAISNHLWNNARCSQYHKYLYFKD